MIYFMPRVHCAQCGKPADKVVRTQDKTERYVGVTCHGKTIRIPFVTAADAEVKVFAPPEPEPEPAALQK